jgi:hypothetical protein
VVRLGRRLPSPELTPGRERATVQAARSPSASSWRSGRRETPAAHALLGPSWGEVLPPLMPGPESTGPSLVGSRLPGAERGTQARAGDVGEDEDGDGHEVRQEGVEQRPLLAQSRPG